MGNAECVQNSEPSRDSGAEARTLQPANDSPAKGVKLLASRLEKNLVLRKVVLLTYFQLKMRFLVTVSYKWYHMVRWLASWTTEGVQKPEHCHDSGSEV